MPTSLLHANLSPPNNSDLASFNSLPGKIYIFFSVSLLKPAIAFAFPTVTIFPFFDMQLHDMRLSDPELDWL